MDVYRQWFCTCTGKPIELSYEGPPEEEEPSEPVCVRCGATPSSDPRRTVIYKDVPEWED